MPTEVQIISAAWCKRCHEIKPSVADLCVFAGAKLTVIDYDSLEDEDELKKTVKALPTVRMRSSTEKGWVAYIPAELEKWKADVTALAVAAERNGNESDDDF
jgi:hypothetical protein